jgi:hypothetical protein
MMMRGRLVDPTLHSANAGPGPADGGSNSSIVLRRPSKDTS